MFEEPRITFRTFQLILHYVETHRTFKMFFTVSDLQSNLVPQAPEVVPLWYRSKSPKLRLRFQDLEVLEELRCHEEPAAFEGSL